jgi:hypothetical protein
VGRSSEWSPGSTSSSLNSSGSHGGRVWEWLGWSRKTNAWKKYQDTIPAGDDALLADGGRLLQMEQVSPAPKGTSKRCQGNVKAQSWSNLRQLEEVALVVQEGVDQRTRL